jgi:hypothetical protein
MGAKFDIKNFMKSVGIWSNATSVIEKENR